MKPAMQPAVMPANKYLEVADCSWLNVVGRLKDGVSLQQLQVHSREARDASRSGGRSSRRVKPVVL